MNERESKLKAIQQVFIEEVWQTPWDTKRASERILQAVEQVALDFEYAR